MGRGGASAAGLALMLAAGSAFGQAAPAGGLPCVLDKCLRAGDPSGPDPAPAVRRGPPAPGAFDFYVLALSWSPGFCDAGGAAKSPDQCAAGRSLGFVVHGLWPQNTRGYPSDCDAGSRVPPRAALEAVRDLYPDTGLARYEWRKHGTCTGLSPTAYFATVRRAREGIVIPPAMQAPSEPRTVAPIEIARSFIAANPGLRLEAMAVTCREGELQEVRLCLPKDLRGFTACPEVARDACRTRSITVLPVQ